MKVKRFIPLIVAILAAIWFYGLRGAWADRSGDGLKAVEGTGPRSLTILFLWVDNGGFSGNTDSIMVLHADPETRRVAVLSVPRDTRVRISRKPDKINAANARGGPKLTVALLEDLLDTRIDSYVMVDFEGFKRFVDAIGGIDVMVDRNMDRDDPYQDLHIHLRKGFQHLDGEKAMQFIRFRDDALGDITRVGRQQVFLKAVAAKLSQPETAVRLPVIIPRIFRLIRTDLSLPEALGFYAVVKEQDRWTIVSGTLPGSFLDVGGVSYWSVRPEMAKNAWRRLVAGRSLTAFDPAAPVAVTGTVNGAVPEAVYENIYAAGGTVSNSVESR